MLIGRGRYLEAFERDVSGRLNAGLTIQGEIKGTGETGGRMFGTEMEQTY